MDPVGAASDWEVWKWVLSVLAGAAGGVVTVIIAAGSLIFKLNTTSNEVLGLKEIIYKKGQGLNVLTEDKHKEICETTFELWGKDFDHIKEKFGDLEEKVDDMAEKVEIMVSTGKAFETHARELVLSMHDLMTKLNEHREGMA